MEIYSSFFKSGLTKSDLEYYRSVIVICAGGTINMSGLEQRKPSDGVARALSSISGKLAKADVSFVYDEPLFDRPPDSSNIGENEWKTILQRIDSIIERKKTISKRLLDSGIKAECGGVVIAHGTDTLHITSLVIALEMTTRRLQFPIVFTASHSTLDDPHSDAAGNLHKSIFIAKERFNYEANLPAGVYVLIGQEIHLASRLTKVYTMPNSDGKYFYSFPSPVGQVSSAPGGNYRYRVSEVFLHELLKMDKSAIAGLDQTKPWGIVEHLYLDRFVNVDVVSDYKRRVNTYKSIKDLENRSMGLVIQGDFKNNTSFDEIAEELKQIEDMGVIICLGSKQTYCSLKKHRNYSKLVLIPKSLSHQKAKIKLGWLLKNSISTDRVIELMSKNLAGEVFQTDYLPEWINFETFHNCSQGAEVVIAYPDIHPSVLEDAILRLNSSHSLNGRRELFLYGFGDGHYPTVNLSIAEIVKQYLNSLQGFDYQIATGASLEVILSSVIDYISNNKEVVLNHLLGKYDLASWTVLEEKMKHFVYRDEVEKATAKISARIKSSFIKLRDDGDAYIDLSSSDLDSISEFARSKVKIRINDSIVAKRLLDFRKEYEESSNKMKGALNYIASNFPIIIAQRLIKDALMECNKNMSIIGHATDDKIVVHLKTLAVKSKTDSLKYEIGNMFMLLGADSDKTKGIKNEIFIQRKGGILA